jgi:hypothetical protein
MPEQIIVSKVSSLLEISNDETVKILEKVEIGGEMNGLEPDEWFENRFKPNLVFIDERDYARMCIDALKILSKTAATDYGSSRQRDMGQLWADMTRGYLGEQAFVQFLKQNFNITAQLGHERGELKTYLPMDISKINKPGEKPREPKLKIGIKTTKWNGIWLDIPGNQFEHSDVHALVKVGAGRDHLFAFFKSLSVFKDKILKKGLEVGVLTEIEADALYNELPSFKPVPAYICGFVRKAATYADLPYSGKKGRLNYKITSWNGQIKPGDLEKIVEANGLKGSIKFEGIGDFAHDAGYLFNTGNLLWKKEDWNEVIKAI